MFPPFELYDSHESEDERIVEYLRERLAIKGRENTKPVILDAGCSANPYLERYEELAEVHYLDFDPNIVRHLASSGKYAFQADLAKDQLPVETYDVVWSAFVLEHIQGAERALDNIVASLKVGGQCILSLPDPTSLYGFLSRLSPHWVKVLIYRYLFKRQTAGKIGYPPWRSYYEPIVSREGLVEYCVRKGLTVELAYQYLQKHPPLPAPVWRILGSFSRVLNKNIDENVCNFVLVFSKRAPGGREWKTAKASVSQRNGPPFSADSIVNR